MILVCLVCKASILRYRIWIDMNITNYDDMMTSAAVTSVERQCCDMVCHHLLLHHHHHLSVMGNSCKKVVKLNYFQLNLFS